MGHMWRSLPWLNEPSHLLSWAHIQKCSRACSDPSSPDPESQSPDSSSQRQMVFMLPAESRLTRHVNLRPVSPPQVFFTVTQPRARSKILGKMTHSLLGKMYISKNLFPVETKVFLGKDLMHQNQSQDSAHTEKQKLHQSQCVFS